MTTELNITNWLAPLFAIMFFIFNHEVENKGIKGFLVFLGSVSAAFLPVNLLVKEFIFFVSIPLLVGIYATLLYIFGIFLNAGKFKTSSYVLGSACIISCVINTLI